MPIKFALAAILLACIFDLFDGRVARMGGHESPFGREFDVRLKLGLLALHVADVMLVIGVGRLEFALEKIDRFQAFRAVRLHFREVGDGFVRDGLGLVAVLFDLAQIGDGLLGGAAGFLDGAQGSGAVFFQ